ncbi:hypothetical protein PMAYCL1PPCAC_13080, partial [Pristionchus mayeri]
LSQSAMHFEYTEVVDTSVPNVFGNFEATLGVLGAEAFLLLIFLICTWKISCKDVAKPFVCILSLCMLITTVGTISLFVFKMCHLAYALLYYASLVRTIGRFASVNSLLFGGGFFLIGAGNAVRTREEPYSCFSWLIHLSIAVFSALVSYSSIFFYLENVPLFLLYSLPILGFLFLLFGLVVGLLLSCCGGSEKEVDSTERSLVHAKSRFFCFVLFLIVPVALVCLTRVLDGVRLIVDYLNYMSAMEGYIYWNGYKFAQIASMMGPTIATPTDLEMFFTLSVTLSSFFFLRSVLFSSSKIPKTTPANSSAFTTPQPMTMMFPAPQMVPAPYLPTPLPLNPSPIPALNQYHPIVYGMGGRPVYMMA